ncbi:MAG: aspartate carbamoyltransferase catalytic subunit [Bdellovibrionota bacterium]|jgi:aspartate carbamoyltransferase catalytic subunit
MPKHLLGIQHLSLEELYVFLNNAQNFVEVSERDIKKVPTLRGKTIVNMFLEPSTRTRTSFEIAGKRLSGDVVNVSASGSSLTKGESLLDMGRAIQAMSPDILVVRHKATGAPHFFAHYLKSVSVVNAGDGMNEHPTQALLDLLSLRQRFQGRKHGIEKLRIAIVGDVRHSRVARSNVWAHKLLGNEVNLVGPNTLVPRELGEPSCFGEGTVKLYSNLVEGIEGADVVMCLRMQLERMQNNFVPTLEEYSNEFFITEKLLSKYAPTAVVMHPGPINRGVEVETDLIDGERSLVEQQVRNGVAVRMAVLFALATGVKEIK